MPDPRESDAQTIEDFVAGDRNRRVVMPRTAALESAGSRPRQTEFQTPAGGVPGPVDAPRPENAGARWTSPAVGMPDSSIVIWYGADAFTLTADVDQIILQLSRVALLHGFGAIRDFVAAVRTDLEPLRQMTGNASADVSGVSDAWLAAPGRLRIGELLREAEDRVGSWAAAFLREFETYALTLAIARLDATQKIVASEFARYGEMRHPEPGMWPLRYYLVDSDGTRGLMAAVARLARLHDELDTAWHNWNLAKFHWVPAAVEAQAEKAWKAASLRYDEARQAEAVKFPVLLRTAEQLFTVFIPSDEAARIIETALNEVLNNTEGTKTALVRVVLGPKQLSDQSALIGADKLSVFQMPDIVQLALNDLRIGPASLEYRVVTDMAARIRGAGQVRGQAETALLSLLLLVPGAQAVAAFGLAVISTWRAIDAIRHYSPALAAHAADLDPAIHLIDEEPSLLGVYMDAAAALLDLHGFVKAVGTLQPLFRNAFQAAGAHVLVDEAARRAGREFVEQSAAVEAERAAREELRAASEQAVPNLGKTADDAVTKAASQPRPGAGAPAGGTAEGAALTTKTEAAAKEDARAAEKVPLVVKEEAVAAKKAVLNATDLLRRKILDDPKVKSLLLLPGVRRNVEKLVGRGTIERVAAAELTADEVAKRLGEAITAFEKAGIGSLKLRSVDNVESLFADWVSGRDVVSTFHGTEYEVMQLGKMLEAYPTSRLRVQLKLGGQKAMDLVRYDKDGATLIQFKSFASPSKLRMEIGRQLQSDLGRLERETFRIPGPDDSGLTGLSGRFEFYYDESRLSMADFERGFATSNAPNTDEARTVMIENFEEQLNEYLSQLAKQSPEFTIDGHPFQVTIKPTTGVMTKR